jgi:hypothetical protein
MVEVNLCGYGRQWLAEVSLIIETPEMREARIAHGISDQRIKNGDYPGGPHYSGF